MGVVFEAVKSLLPTGRLRLRGDGGAITGGMADAVDALKTTARGKTSYNGIPYVKPDYPDNLAGAFYFNDAWVPTPSPPGGATIIDNVAGKLAVSSIGGGSTFQVFGPIGGLYVKMRVAVRIPGPGSVTLKSYNGITETIIGTASGTENNAFFTVEGYLPSDSILVSAYLGSTGYIIYDWVYVGDGTYLTPSLQGGIIGESWPGTAVDTLPAWHETMGIAYDPSARSTAEAQTMLAAMESGRGGNTLANLQAQLDKEFGGRVVVSEAYITGVTGFAVTGLARCGLSSSIIYSLGYTVSGTVYSSTEAARVGAILARYAPAHLEPNSILTDLSATSIALLGLARTGIARTGKAS